MEEDTFEHGDATQDVTELVEQLRDYEVPDSIIDSVRKGTMLQSDYTRKRQEEAAEVSRLREQVAYLAGQVQRSQQQEEADELDAYLRQIQAEAGDDPTSQHVAKFLTEIGTRARNSAAKNLQSEMAALKQTQVETEADRRLQNWYKTELVSKYGNEAIKLITPELHDAMTKLYVKQGSIDPESILRKLNEDRMDALKQQAKLAKQQRNQTRHTEGFTETRRTSPPSGTEPNKGKQPNSTIVDPAKLTDRIFRRMASYQ